MSKDVQVPNSWKFLFGGLSGCGAAAVVQPMDLVKNRMQVHHFLFPYSHCEIIPGYNHTKILEKISIL